MHYQLTSVFIALCSTAFSQWNVSAGYTYQVDHKQPEAAASVIENPYTQNEVVVQGGYMTQHNWEFSVEGSFLQNQQEYYQDRYSRYSDCGAGGCSASVSGPATKQGLPMLYSPRMNE